MYLCRRLDGNPIMKVNEHALESTPNLHTAYVQLFKIAVTF